VTGYKRGVRIAITIAPQISRSVDDLLATGLFGFNRAHVIERLLSRALMAEDVMPFWRGERPRLKPRSIGKERAG
jgi:hypothetical protein